MRRILFTAAARSSCAPQSAAGENGPSPNTRSADNVHFTADYYGARSQLRPDALVCAGEHIGNTGQVVRDAEACPSPGPGTAQYQPRLYQNLGQLRPAAAAVFKLRTAPQRGWAPCGKT
jgi:hypothetical protein